MLRKFLVLALLGASAAGSVAVAQMPPPPDQSDRGPRHHPGMFPGLEQLNLSDAQRSAIQQAYASHSEEMRSMFQSEHQQRKAFMALDPASPTYAAQVNVIAQQAASLASARVQQMAGIWSQINAVLTPDQKAQLASIAASEPAMPPPPQQ